MPNFALLSLVATTQTNKQALQTFGADGLATTPRALGHTPCDTDGVALMGRTVHDVNNDPEATDAVSTALPAYAKRARLMIQNLSDSDLLWFDFGTPAVAGASFKCFAGQMLIIDSAPADAVSVITDTGLTVNYVAKDW